MTGEKSLLHSFIVLYITEKLNNSYTNISNIILNFHMRIDKIQMHFMDYSKLLKLTD